MEVLKILKLHMGHIVTEIYSRCNTQQEFLDEMYNIILFDIGINFDSQYFYLMDYKKLGQNNIYFNITNPHVPRDLLIMIKNLITHGRMKENIKNKNFRINFRDFIDEVKLEDKENTLRVEAYMQMHKLCTNSVMIRIYLIGKHTELVNNIKKLLFNTDHDVAKLIQFRIHKFRIEQILKTIQMYTIHAY
jgi:hypothetical protein